MGELDRHSALGSTTASSSGSDGTKSRGKVRDRTITVLLVDARSWRRESYAKALTSAGQHLRVLGFASFPDAERALLQDGTTLLLLNLEGVPLADVQVSDLISTAQSCLPGLPIVVVSDSADAAEILNLINHGVSGYLPISLEVQMVIDALRLVAAGGTYIPAEPVLTSIEDLSFPTSPGELLPEGETANREATDEESPTGNHFALISALESLTPRQRKVLGQLRQGKSNKHIARELDLSEATIKVHVGNIMRKLQVSNRTQVAVLVEGLEEDLDQEDGELKTVSED